MATARSFSAMLNEYLTESLMKEELLSRDWLLKNVQRDDGWKTGTIPVPFQAAQASTVQFGGLAAATDIAEYQYVRGTINNPVELWGTLKFAHRDLMEHDGGVKEKTFLKILPDQIEQFMTYIKEVASMQMLNGAHFALFVADTDLANGKVKVSNIDRFVLGQKVTIIDSNTAQADYYVTAIDLNTEVITVSATRGGAAADISAFTTAASAKIYHPGVLVGGVVTNAFQSVRGALLSATNGGDANLHGVSKISAPYLQCVNIPGNTVSASNILEKLFDGYTAVRQKARGNANKIVMSYKHLGSIMKLIETQKGAYKVTARDTRASIYGWTEIDITSVKGELTLVGIQEMNDTEIFYLDLSSFKFFSNGFFRKRTAPDGKQYYEIRGAGSDGYSYLLDVALTGQMACLAPSKNGVMYGISY